MDSFDFNEWMNLANTDPDEFQARRQRLLKEMIAAAPEQHRVKLYLLQAKIDTICQAHEPLESTILITKMLVNNLDELKKQMMRLKEIIIEIQ